MITSEITTAARRIARTVNGTPEALTVVFDEDGRALDYPGYGLEYIDGAPEGAKYRCGGRREFSRIDDGWGRHRMTYREAQDIIDGIDEF